MPNSNLVLHELTQQHIAQYTAQPSHALLLVGPDGIGKASIARHVAAALLQLGADPLESSAQLTIIEPDEKNTISIEAIRKLQHFLKLKTSGTQAIRRIVIIEHAQAMTLEAQNAFLKLLEEPPADTALLLTVDNPQTLLPTILSRVQSIKVLEPHKGQLLSAFGAYPTQAVTQAYFLSGGLPGLMTALLKEDVEHPLLKSVAQAKMLLQQDLFARLTHIDQIGKQRPDAIQLCIALRRIAQTALEQAAIKSDVRRITQWQRIIKAVAEAQDLLSVNVNTKLTLTQLMLRLSA